MSSTFSSYTLETGFFVYGFQMITVISIITARNGRYHARAGNPNCSNICSFHEQESRVDYFPYHFKA